MTAGPRHATVLIFDDWFAYKGRLDRGEAKAFREWLDANPSIQATEYHKSGRTMNSFIMHVGDERATAPVSRP
jgi:hypothetical protein